MELSNKYIGHSGVEYIFEYFDADSFDNLDHSLCKQAYAVCFCGEKIVLVYQGHKKTWGLVGGSIEKGESFEQTLEREIKEESNMKVIDFLPIGYQKVIDTRDNSFVYQLRYVCTAEPYGPFTSDPAGAITKVELVDPKDYKHYFDWGEIGDRIITQALRFKGRLDNNGK